MAGNNSSKESPQYDLMLGWPLDEANIVEGSRVCTEDGQHWVSINNVIRVFPDHWKDDKPELKSVPAGTTVVTLSGIELTA